MGLFNQALNALFDLMLVPFGALHPWVGLAVVSLVMAVVALLAFRYVSNADAIQRIKTRIGGYLLEMRLFPDSLRILVTDPLKIFGLNLRYMGHALVPFLLILPPMILAIVQLESRFALRPLEPGEQTVLTASFREGVDVLAPELAIETSDGLRVETPSVRIPALGQASWRLRATAVGEQWVRIVPPGGGADDAVQKLVWVDGAPRRLARARTARYAGFAALAEPAEAPLPRGGAFTEIRIGLPERESRFGGLSTSVWVFFVMATVFGFALKDRLGVTL